MFGVALTQIHTWQSGVRFIELCTIPNEGFETTACDGTQMNWLLSPQAGQRIRMLFAMQFARSDGFNSIPSATGGIARLACARLDELGKDPTVILSKVGLTPEEARDPAVRLEVRTQIKLLELAAEEVQDEWLGFHLARSFDLREIGLVYYVMASSEQLADALRNAARYSQINNEGVCLRFTYAGRISSNCA